MKGLRIIISGGGTGGHIFPAISIANALKELLPDTQILFVGAQDRMEMQRVPAAGYQIVGLPIRGLVRPLWKPANISIMLDFLKSKRLAKKHIQKFRPHVAVGVGGYASSATLNAAHDLGIPCLIQEQNSFAGLTNKTLAQKAKKICVAYEGMERFFPKERILLTGNPVRQNLLNEKLAASDCRESFGLNPNLPTLLVVGGSLGARTINESLLSHYEEMSQAPMQVIWQTGGYYYKQIMDEISKKKKAANIVVTDFIAQMDKAYKASDLVISRAGASSISELCLLGKPSILVPSPNVAEDHQTHNAMALVKRDAAIMVTDADARQKLVETATKTLQDHTILNTIGRNAQNMALKDSAQKIAQEIIKLAQEYSLHV